VLVKHPDTWIITDDIYNRMVFDGVGIPQLRAGPSRNCVTA
jgi:aspartate/methionine/tyrosine aminotransferase